CYEWSSRVNCGSNEKCVSGRCEEIEEDLGGIDEPNDSSVKYDFDEIEILSVELFNITKSKDSGPNTWADYILGNSNNLEIIYSVFNLKKQGQIFVNNESFLKIKGENGDKRFLLNSQSFTYYEDGSIKSSESQFWSAKKLIGDDIIKDKTPPVYSATLLRNYDKYRNVVSTTLSFSDNGLIRNEENEIFNWEVTRETVELPEVSVQLTSEYCDINQNKCWVSDKVNAEITAEVFVNGINNLVLQIFDSRRVLIKEQNFVSPKEGKFMTTFDFLEEAGKYNAKIIFGNNLLYSFEIESVSFDENLRFSTVKNATGKKITLAYYSRDFNLDELKNFASVSSGYTGIDGLLNLDPISNYKDNFEIVAVTASKDIRGNLLTDFIDYNIGKQDASFVIYIMVYSGGNAYRATAGLIGAGCSNRSESGITLAVKEDNLNEAIKEPFIIERTIAHEFGHSFGCLGDEYFETPATFQSAPNIDVEGCPKWCEGELDTQKPNYPDYLELKKCLSDYIDPSSGLFKNYDSDKEDIDACLYTTIIEKGQPVVVEKYPNKYLWEFGTYCIEGTGCYFTANGLLEWRPQGNTIMRYHFEQDADFSVIGKREINNKLRMLLES
ncbi:MAG: hypothetical protein V1788_02045, partial [Nanoarchaeota archaeon]